MSANWNRYRATRANLPRRSFLSLAGAVAAGRALSACGAATSTSPAPANDASGVDTAASCATADAGASGLDAGVWATGGTAAMTGKASYPNPFAGGCNAPASCSLTCELTQGPCYSAQSVEIQDISYGYSGLPVRMYIRVMDESCHAVPGAVIDVWHVSPVGKYSGDDAANEDIAFCTGNDGDFTSHLYFRGKQTTDSNGVAIFDTCYPGWYASRTVHVHLTISVAGSAYVTTQLCFDDALDDAIIASQPLYDQRGARDTTNSSDTVFSASDYQNYEFQVQRMTDGAMLAWKTIIVRGSPSGALCGQSSGEGGPMGGGPPGGEGGPPTPPASGEGGGMPGPPPDGGVGGPNGPPPSGRDAG
jgi:protocatechuate 3,4-dioxygenase beta subunit